MSGKEVLGCGVVGKSFSIPMKDTAEKNTSVIPPLEMVMSVYTCGHVMSVYTVCYVCVCVWGYMCVHAGYYTNMV